MFATSFALLVSAITSFVAPQVQSAVGIPGAAETFEGTWLGKVTAPNATTELGFAFTRNGAGLDVTIYMPEMFLYGVKLGPAQIEGDTFTLDALATTLKRTGDKLVGTFAPAHLPVELQRGGTFAAEPPRAAVPAGPAPLWSCELGARAWATPVVSGGVVYVGTVDGKLHAVLASDGHELWRAGGFAPLYGEAVVVGNNLLIVDERCTLASVQLKDGGLRWSVPLCGAERAHKPAPSDETFNHRTAAALVDDGVAYLGSIDGSIYALDANTGTRQWRYEGKTPIHCALALLGKERLVAACFDGTLLVLDRNTHQEVARAKLPGAIASTPVVAGDTLVVGCRDYMLYGLKLGDLSIAWRDSYWFSWVESVPRLVDGTLYIGGSDFRRISALDPASGKAQWASDVGGLTWGTPFVTADTVYAGASAQTPALIAHEGGIVALDRKSGEVRWRAPFAYTPGSDRAGIIGSLARAGDKLVAVTYDGVLVAYSLK